MSTQGGTPYRLKRRVVAPYAQRIQVRLTIDSRFTQYNFDRLSERCGVQRIGDKSFLPATMRTSL